MSIDIWQPYGPALVALDAASGGVFWTADAGDALVSRPDGYGAHGIGAAPAIAGPYVVVAGLDGVIAAYPR